MIDKKYVMGFSIADNGYIYNDEKAPKYLQEAATKNRVVENILQIVTNPKNQINLTMPVTTDRVQAIAAKSELGKNAKLMNPYNPMSKYMMQIENMVGKKVIGNVATAIKTFFALSNVYNQVFEDIYNMILDNREEEALELLKRYTFRYNDRLITLANVNMDLFENIWVQYDDGTYDYAINNPELKQMLKEIIEWENDLEDQSMILGEILNLSTDESYNLLIIN